ncbi:hypothetical protein [Dyadobacter psychrotolerans]|uniref:Uncharacterized protein n=1 Tax=Dyadobacter psychrotolerans TaxID=2541721 RepID=A0A4V2Z464_9BACT|nr:hypothetical protein [Dyadobacter psychrotolerans]TDE14828.1 hypothetical protein E0F88_16740 [Dyadobacter psychrotolerans]
MIAKQEPDSTREDFIAQITALKKQSVFALLLALVLIITTVYLLILLDQRKTELAASETTLIAKNAELSTMSDSVQKMNKQMETWRQLQMQTEKNERVRTASPIRTADGFIVAAHIDAKVVRAKRFFGYIIYIQDRRKSAISDTLRSILTLEGAITPAIQHIGSAMKFKNSVKYFHDSDKGAAEDILSLLLNLIKERNLSLAEKNLPVIIRAKGKVPVGQFEIWIDN